MNDRFKFRGITKGKVNKFVYGSLLWYAGDPQIWDEYGKNFIVQPQTVGQCTGLKDKNGTLIYEGDIVKIPDNWDIYGQFAGEKREVYYNEGFRLKPKWDKNSRGNWLEDIKDFEVIGNIYQDRGGNYMPYVIRNCPSAIHNVMEEREIFYCANAKNEDLECQACTDCILKQIVEKCKRSLEVSYCPIEREILELLDIQEVE